MTDNELRNISLLSSDLANFIASKPQTNIEKTYSLLYAAMALNLDSEISMQFLEEAFLKLCRLLITSRV